MGQMDVKCCQCYVAAQRFHGHLKDAGKQHIDWDKLPHAQKLQYEQQYIYGIQSLPPVQDFLEGHMRYSLIQAILTAYGHYGSTDVLFHILIELFPNKETFRLQMSEEVNLIPFDKSTLTFNNAANVLETWIQKYEVARYFGSHIEPQKMVAIVQRIVDAIRNSNGEPDQVFYMDYYNQFSTLGIRDMATNSNVETLAKQILVTLGSRTREAAVQEDEEDVSDEEQTSPKQTSGEDATESEGGVEEPSEVSEEEFGSEAQSSVGAMALIASEGKVYALADSGATNVTLNLKHFLAHLKAEATLMEMTLAKGKVDAYLHLDEVYAEDVKMPLCPIRRLTMKLDISIEWTKDHCIL
eukprot:1593952-Amphidinium_carterae.1